MAKVKKIKILSFAKFQAVLTALVGLVAGIVYSFGGFIYEALTGTLNSGTALAFFALIGMPLSFGIFGFIMGLIEAFLYNLFAKWLGRIEIDFER